MTGEKRLLTETEIRCTCLGEGLYEAGELGYTASDPVPKRMPMFGRVAAAQFAKDLEWEKEKARLVREQTAREILEFIQEIVIEPMVNFYVGKKRQQHAFDTWNQFVAQFKAHYLPKEEKHD